MAVKFQIPVKLDDIYITDKELGITYNIGVYYNMHDAKVHLIYDYFMPNGNIHRVKIKVKNYLNDFSGIQSIFLEEMKNDAIIPIQFEGMDEPINCKVTQNPNKLHQFFIAAGDRFSVILNERIEQNFWWFFLGTRRWISHLRRMRRHRRECRIRCSRRILERNG